MTEGDHEQLILHEHLSRRVDDAEKKLQDLHSFRDKIGDPEALHKRVRKLEDFKLVITVAVMSVSALVIYVSMEGWKMLKSLFGGHQ